MSEIVDRIMTLDNAHLSNVINKNIITIGDTDITILSVVYFGISIFFTVVFLGLNGAFFRRLQSRADSANVSSLYILQRFSHYLLITIGLLVSLSAIGIDFTHLALLATALSVGLGFGLQSIFNNFFSGIIILLERSMRVGDYIELDGGISGIVKEINIRSTLVKTRNNVDVLVPNSEFVNGRVSNWTLGDPFTRYQIPFGVAYGTDKEKVKEAALQAAKNVPLTLNQAGMEPDVWLVNFGESSLDFQLVVWVDPRKNTRPGGITALYLWELETALNEHNIEIPFPQRDLHIKSGNLS